MIDTEQVLWLAQEKRNDVPSEVQEQTSRVLALQQNLDESRKESANLRKKLAQQEEEVLAVKELLKKSKEGQPHQDLAEVVATAQRTAPHVDALA